MGIGIFLKAAQALFIGGPIAMVLAYLWVGTVAYSLTVKSDLCLC
jgi:amino acid permease